MTVGNPISCTNHWLAVLPAKMNGLQTGPSLKHSVYVFNKPLQSISVRTSDVKNPNDVKLGALKSSRATVPGVVNNEVSCVN